MCARLNLFPVQVQSLLERVLYGTCWFGLFFEVEALEDRLLMHYIIWP